MIKGSGPFDAKIMIVGEAPGEEESRREEPFVGLAGQELNRMLAEVGLHRSQVFCTNVFRAYPKNGDVEQFVSYPLTKAKMNRPEWTVLPGIGNSPAAAIINERARDLDMLRKEIELVQPNVIVPMGNVALWALTGNWGITKWRGSMLGGGNSPKIIPTFNPAAILRQWEIRPAAIIDMRRVARESTSRIYKDRPFWAFGIRPSFPHVHDTLSRLMKEPHPKLVLDIETRAGHTACLGIGWSPVDALCIPFMCVERAEGYWEFEEELWIIKALKQILTTPGTKVVGQNLSYDYQYLYREWGYYPPDSRDTMINHHLCYVGWPKALDFQASVYCEDYIFWKEDGKEWERGMGEDVLWRYNCLDVVRTWECDEATWKNVQRNNLTQQSAERHRTFYRALKAMRLGIRLEPENQRAFGVELTREVAERQTRIEAIAGHPLNPRSPKQMQKFFYDDLKLPVIKNRKTHQPTCDDDALARLARKEPLVQRIIRYIQEIRTLGIYKSNFVEAKLDRDGRLRCSFNICGTETFRLSAGISAFGSGANFQTIPSGDETPDPGELQLPNVKKMFAADPDYTFFDADLDRADLQVVAWEANDDDLKHSLRSGEDLHATNAKLLRITRPLAKRWVHGTNYGGQPRTMAISCGITVHVAEQLQARWFAAHPGIAEWHRRTEAFVRAHRYIENRFGYRRYYFERLDGILPQVLAWVPQSTVAIVIDKVWDGIEANAEWIQVLLQVHDSIGGQIPTNRLDEGKEIIARVAREIVIPYDDPLVIPLGIKTSPLTWGDCQ